MKTIDRFTKAEARELNKAAHEALKAVAEQFGLTIKPGSARYSPDSCTVKYEFGCLTEAGAPAGFTDRAKMLRLPEDCWGKEFTVNGETYTITDLNLRRRKYPVSANNSRGASYKFTAEMVRRTLAHNLNLDGVKVGGR